MANLEEYANKYRHVRMERRERILQITLHSEGGSLQWGAGPHRELPQAFRDIGGDQENRVIIMTGEGDVGANPRMARLMHQRIANARLNILAGLRHSILNEAPDIVAAALGDFL